MATKKVEQNRFDGGNTENIRDTSGNKVWYTENVNLDSKVNSGLSLVKNPGSYNTATHIIKLLEVGSEIFGLGQDNTTDKKTTIYKKTIGYSNSFTGYTPATSYVLETINPFFLYDGGYIYYLNGAYISRFTVADNTNTYNWLSLSGANNSKMYGGVNWQGDFYGFSGQNIYKITPAGALTDKLLITGGQVPVQLIPYGNYLMIVCSSLTGVSQAYLWDGTTTTTFADIVKIGKGTVAGGELKDGIPYVVLVKRQNEINILAYTGGIFKVVSVYNAKPNRAGSYTDIRVVTNIKSTGDGIYFMAIGSKPDSTLASLIEAQVFLYTDNLLSSNSLFGIAAPDSTVSNSGTLSATGDDVLLSENIALSTNRYYPIVCLNGLSGAETSQYYEADSAGYATGVVETTIYNGFNTHAEKTLKKVVLSYDPLPTAGSVTLKYKINEETNKAASTWTTIFADSTDYNVTHSAVNIESTGLALPTFKEIQFRIELSGGAKITGFKFYFDELEEKDY